MVYINILNITPDRSKIQVSVETGEGYNITEVRLWTHLTYKKESEAMDLTTKLSGINNKEVFNINASDINLSQLNGLFFVEFTSNQPPTECSTCSSTMIGVAASFKAVDDCILNKVLEVNVCDTDIFSDSSCNGNKAMEIVNLQLILDNVCRALERGYYNTAIDLYKSLVKLCSIKDCKSCNTCTNCTEEGNTFSGLGYGTLNNTLILM